MSLVRLENIVKRFQGETVLDGVSWRIEQGEKIGLIGRNGSGKSTLFRLIAGDMAPDQGVVERMKRARIASLDQIPTWDESASLLDFVKTAFHELMEMQHRLRELEHQIAEGDERAMQAYSTLQDAFTVRGGYTFQSRVERVLTGLGFTEKEFNLPITALSGGQRTRLRLAIVLLDEADLLLLDEPENHLDLEAREWLEGFLKDCPHAFVVISHDRRMLNATVERVAEVEQGTLHTHTGNYDAYIAAKALQQEQQQKTFERQQAFLAKEQRFIDRFRYKNTKASQVQSRIKRLDKMDWVDAPAAGGKAAVIRMNTVQRSGHVVLTARDLSMAYDDLRLYSQFSFQAERGDRIGIIGPNGSGKTTLLRHLAGMLEGGTGEVLLGHKVRLGYYDQQHADLNPSNDILTEVHQARPDWKPGDIRTFLGKLLFTGEDVFKLITALSGGERSRVAIAKLILQEANLLLLDEPTNHLDIASREVLEDALDGFQGSLVMVSHDRTLIDKLVNKLIIVENGEATLYRGNYSSYRWKQQDPEAESKQERANQQDVLRIRQQKARAKGKDSRNQQRKIEKQLQEVESDIESIEKHLAEMEETFAQFDPADYEAALDLKSEYDALKTDLREMYSEWEKLAEQLD